MILLFDLDDTLVPSSKAYDQGLRAIGIEPGDELYLRARAEVKRACPVGYPSAHSRRLYFKRWLEIQDLFSPRRHLEMVNGYETTVCEFLARAWRELDRPRLFAQLQGQVDAIGVITNEGATMQSAKLHALDPNWEFFDFLVTSEELGVGKPEAAMFLRALELARATPSDSLLVGDSFEHDISGAKAVGIRCLQTTEFFSTAVHGGKPQHHDLIEKLTELPEWIRVNANAGAQSLK